MLAKQNLEEETRNLHHIAPVMMLPELPSPIACLCILVKCQEIKL
jgi:hypothetical protein